MDFDAAKSYALDFLKINAGSRFHYHNKDHTLDVFNAISYIAASEKVSRDDTILLKVAALYHDLGILIKYDTHEDESIKICNLMLPGFGFSDNEIEKINHYIEDTHLASAPKTELGKLLRDADLDYLGRDDYFIISDKLKAEWEALEIRKYSFIDWYKFQMEFMTNHDYYSDAAKNARDEGKALNIKKISELLKKV